jgi:hypothetical protein
MPAVGQLYDEEARALAFPQPHQGHYHASQWVIRADYPDAVLLLKRPFLRSVSRSPKAVDVAPRPTRAASTRWRAAVRLSARPSSICWAPAVSWTTGRGLAPALCSSVSYRCSLGWSREWLRRVSDEQWHVLMATATAASCGFGRVPYPVTLFGQCGSRRGDDGTLGRSKA